MLVPYIFFLNQFEIFMTRSFHFFYHGIYSDNFKSCSSIIFNIPRFFELRTEFNLQNNTIFNEDMETNVTEEVKYPVVAPTEFRENLEYSRDYVLIANSVALGFIPILTLIVLNSCIFRTISQATQRHNAISSNQRRDHSVSTSVAKISHLYYLHTLKIHF